MSRKAGESIESIVERKASDLHIQPLRTNIPVSQHHMSVIRETRLPYVCADIETQRAFIRDDDFIKHGIRSYIGLPLMQRGELIGVVDFLSLENTIMTTMKCTCCRPCLKWCRSLFPMHWPMNRSTL
jgi:GAF domain-containing protein